VRIAAALLTAALLTAALAGTMPVCAEKGTETETETELTVAETEAAAVLGSGIEMSTSYPGLTVKPGDTVSFSLDFASLDGLGHDVSLEEGELPEGWSGYFKGGNNQVTKVHISAAEDAGSSLASYSLTVPAEAEEGYYEIDLTADDGEGSTDVLTLGISVSVEEAGESSFSSEYPEQQGATGSTFSFDTTIVNNRTTAQTYSLSAELPEGWQISFVPSGESAAVTSLPVEAGSSQGLTVTVTPSETVEKGDYEIHLTAVSANDTLKTDLGIEIIGTYSVSLSTADQRLSFDAEAGKQSSVTLTITNTGNVDLENLNLTSSASTDWDVTFSESTIDTLEAGASKEITAYVTPSEDAITGDYVAYIAISNSETSSSAEFRVSVKTSTTWGFAAAGIIVVIILGLAAIFKKYGRR
jgi:uncharacterized membrane protein